MTFYMEMVNKREWHVLDMYLAGIINVNDYRYFEMRKQECLKALNKRDSAKVVNILVKDSKVFATFNEKLVKEITQILILENFSDNEQLSNRWMANETALPYLSASARAKARILKCRRTTPTNNPAMYYRSADFEHVLKRSRLFGISDKKKRICRICNGFVPDRQKSVVAISKHPRTPANNPAKDYRTADSEHVLKRSRHSVPLYL